MQLVSAILLSESKRVSFVFIFSLMAGTWKTLTSLDSQHSKKHPHVGPPHLEPASKLQNVFQLLNTTPSCVKSPSENLFSKFRSFSNEDISIFSLPNSTNYGDPSKKLLDVAVTHQVDSTSGRGCSSRSQGISKELTLAASPEIELAEAKMLGQ